MLNIYIVICAFVFTYTKKPFSHDVAQMILTSIMKSQKSFIFSKSTKSSCSLYGFTLIKQAVRLIDKKESNS